MNDNDYKRLGCAFDGCSTTKIASAGLCSNHYGKQRNQYKPICSAEGCDKPETSKGLCGSHYTRLRSFGYTGDHSLICACCGIGFKSSIMKAVCSIKCRDTKSSRDKGHAPWDEYVKRAKEQVAAKWSSKCCAYCGGAISRFDPSGSRKKATQVNKSCSKACDTALRNKVSREIEGIRDMHRRLVRDTKAARMSIIRTLKALKKAKELMAYKDRPCLGCGNPMNHMGTANKRYCSSQCKPGVNKTTEKYREAKKADRKRRKAKQRGAKVGKPFTCKQVFDRDGWKCQICGTPTPPKHRGTYKPTAPELDHVIPLSKGGEHSMQNTQCLCRSCNAWKSDKLIPSQAGLFSL